MVSRHVNARPASKAARLHAFNGTPQIAPNPSVPALDDKIEKKHTALVSGCPKNINESAPAAQAATKTTSTVSI
uniref:Uncharacterized protein n=1 Tax=Romanomermis culicivorax TaxID=13658 RepID=A0A915KC44_ROMCU